MRKIPASRRRHVASSSSSHSSSSFSISGGPSSFIPSPRGHPARTGGRSKNCTRASSPASVKIQGSLCVACADKNTTDVVVLYKFLGGGGEVGWALAGQFDAGKSGCHGGMTSLGCYRGGDCVIPWFDLVIAMDFDGRPWPPCRQQQA